MTERPLTDDALVARLRAGDDSAFDVVDARYRAPLLRYAERRLGRSRRHLAEELVQETFLRAHRSLRGGDRAVVLGAWLYTVLHNLVVDELRRTVPIVLGARVESARTADGPAVVAERREELRELVAGVVALPARQRAALVGAAVDGLDHATLAASLGTTAGGSRNLVNRARASLARSQDRVAEAA